MASASAGAGVSADLKDVLVITAIALAVTGLPVGAHLIGQVWGIALCAGLAFSVANFAPAAVPATLLASFLFQNLFVSLVSPWIAGPGEFNTIRGYNFLTTVAMWLVLSAFFWTGRPDLRSTAGRLMLATSAVFAFIVLYFMVGAISSPTSAAIYLRNIATPLLVFQACLIASSRSGGGLWPSLKPLGLVLLAYGYAELLARTALFDLVNANSYLGYNLRQQIESGTWLKELRETGQVFRSFEDTLKVDLLNTALLSDLKIQVYRLLGPNFHSVSFAYALAFFALAFLAGGALLYMLAVLPLLVVVGSKGALLYCIVSAVALVTFQATRRRGVMTLYVAILLLSSAAAIVLGLRIGDYHVVGLFGGINGFLKNPFGHGLGSGGNLSVDMSRIDWSRSQAAGETSIAVESAVGVLPLPDGSGRPPGLPGARGGRLVGVAPRDGARGARLRGRRVRDPGHDRQRPPAGGGDVRAARHGVPDDLRRRGVRTSGTLGRLGAERGPSASGAVRAAARPCRTRAVPPMTPNGPGQEAMAGGGRPSLRRYALRLASSEAARGAGLSLGLKVGGLGPEHPHADPDRAQHERARVRDVRGVVQRTLLPGHRGRLWPGEADPALLERVRGLARVGLGAGRDPVRQPHVGRGSLVLALGVVAAGWIMGSDPRLVAAAAIFLITLTLFLFSAHVNRAVIGILSGDVHDMTWRLIVILGAGAALLSQRELRGP